VRPDIKFCGLTRTADVEAAVSFGARYVGVVFAKGPRTVTPEAARELLRNVPSSVGRVGVFGPDLDPEAIAAVARAVGLDVVQLHGDPDELAVARTRRFFGGWVWAALRVRGDTLPDAAGSLFRAADAVVVDAYAPKALGGTGVSVPWAAIREAVSAARGSGRLVLAGGLRPQNVGAAIRALRPDVVDVSSGVESAPGVKDQAKLRAFRDAVVGEVAAR
jgi:phosphoribosylanthranilate isomerase